MQHKIFCVRAFIKTESATAVQRAFRLRFNIQPPTWKSICRCNHQFEQIGCLCKGKSSGQPRVSEENVSRIEESFERSPRKSTRRARRELGIPQPTGWRVLRCCLLFKPYHICLSLVLILKYILTKLSPSFWITLYFELNHSVNSKWAIFWIVPLLHSVSDITYEHDWCTLILTIRVPLLVVVSNKTYSIRIT